MKIFDTLVNTLKEEKPEILFGISLAAGAITLVTSCISAVKTANDISETKEKIEEIKQSKAPETEDPEQFEIAKIKAVRKEVRHCAMRTVRRWIEPVTAGSVSLTAGFNSIKLLRNTCTLLGTGYAALDNRFRYLEKNLINTYGEEEANRLMHGFKEKEVDFVSEDENGKVVTTKKKVRVMDKESNPYSFMFTKGTSSAWKPNNNYNIGFIEGVLAYWDNKLKSGTYDNPEVILLNDVLEDLEMQRTAEGAVTGWVTGRGDGYINGRLIDVYKESVHNGANPRDLVPSVAMNFNCMVNVHEYIGKRKRK